MYGKACRSSKVVLVSVVAGLLLSLGCGKSGGGGGEEEPDLPKVMLFATTAVSESAESFTIEVSLTARPTSDVEIPYTISGTASSPDEHDLVDGTFTIAAMEISTEILVTLVDDEVDELDETIVIEFGEPTNAALGDLEDFVITVLDDDPTPSVAWTAATEGVDEGAGTVSLKVSLTAASGLDVTVPFGIAEFSTATSGEDYEAPGQMALAIPAGELEAEVTFAVLDDAIPEETESAVFDIDAGGIENALAGDVLRRSVLINDNDSTMFVQWDVAGQTAAEADALTVTAKLYDAGGAALVSRQGPDVAVRFGVSGTATRPADHDLTDSSFLFRPNSTVASISLNVRDDGIYEAEEEIVITILGVSGAAEIGIGARDAHTVTVTDDDAQPEVAWTIDAGQAGEASGEYSVTVQLNTVSGEDVTVPFTVAGTADAADHEVVDDSITIPAGTLAAAYLVTILDDELDEDGTTLPPVHETIELTLGTPVGATNAATNQTMVIEIVDDDDPQVVEWAAERQVVGEDVGSFALEVVLDAASGVDVTVPFIAMGTAIPDVDFTAPAILEVTVAAGELQGTVAFDVVDDLLDESSETILLSMLAPVGATLGAITNQTVYISDNDSDTQTTVQWSVASQTVAEGVDATVTVTAVICDLAGQPLATRFGGDVVVSFEADESSTADAADYANLQGSVTIATDQVSGDATFDLVDDESFEADEDLVLTMLSVGSAGNTANPYIGTLSAHTVTIQSDDAEPAVSWPAELLVVAEDADDPEDPEATTVTATVTATLDFVCGVDVTVDYTVSGTAVNPDDHDAVDGSILIEAGNLTGSAEFTVVDDGELETPNETVVLTMSAATNATLGDITELTVIINGEREIYADLSNDSGTEDGNSWETAFVDITDVSDGGIEGVEVPVAEGSLVYIAEGTYVATGTDEEVGPLAVLVLPGQVTVLGGYAAGGGERDAEANPTMISVMDSDWPFVVFVLGDEDDEVAERLVFDGVSLTSDGSCMGMFVLGVEMVDVIDVSITDTQGGLDVEDLEAITIEGCSFERNGPAFGGLLAFGGAEWSTVSVTDCVFEDNEGGGIPGGGAFLIEFWTIEITACEFEGNYSGDDGGGLCMVDLGTADVTDCVFTDNVADGGGGLYCGVFGNSTDGVPGLRIADCTFSGNEADNGPGGGVAVYEGEGVEVVDCVFEDNYSDDVGGGLSVHDVDGDDLAPALVVEGCTFDRNEADDDAGGLFVGEAGGINVSGCSFSSNTSGGWFGGGMSVEYVWGGEFAPSTVSACSFVNNSVSGMVAGGGGFYLWDGYLEIRDCLFDGNRADGSDMGFGGGLAVDGDDEWSEVRVSGSTFTGNNASAYGMLTAWGGGAGFWYEAEGSFEDCVFEFNGVSGMGEGWAFGGGIGYYYCYSPGSIDRCTFVGNYSSEDGGALALEGDEWWGWGEPLFVDRTGFYGNGTDSDGAAVSMYSAGAAFTNCVASGNVANDDGGVLSISDYCNCFMLNCSFTANSAGDNGGAIHARGDDTYVQIMNSILWGDELLDPYEGEGKEIYDYIWWGGFYVTSSDIDQPFGQMRADPLFVDPDGADNIPGTPDDDLRLSASSPCIDAGSEGGMDGMAAPWWDFDGVLRPQGLGYDMGAYEAVESAPKPAVDVSGWWTVDFKLDDPEFDDEWFERVSCVELTMDSSGRITGEYDGSLVGLPFGGDGESFPVAGQVSGYDVTLTFYSSWDRGTWYMTYVGTVAKDGNSAGGEFESYGWGDGEWRAIITDTRPVTHLYVEYDSVVEVGEEWFVRVLLVDYLNEQILDMDEPVTLWLTDPDTDETVPLDGTTTVTSEHGIAMFAGLSTTVAGTFYIHASCGIAREYFEYFGPRPTVTVQPAPAVRLEFVEQPTDALAGAVIDPAIEVAAVDQYGNPVSAVHSVTLSFDYNAGAGSLGGTVIRNTSLGVATFADITVSASGQGYTLTASAASLVPGYSASFDVTYGDVAGLLFSVPPVDPVAGQVIVPPVTVVAVDAQGNTVPDVAGTIDLAIGTDPTMGRATFSGTLQADMVDSVAVFDDLSMDVASPGFTLTADCADPVLSGESPPFDLLPGAPGELAFSTQPGNVVFGEFLPDFSVEILDVLGNRVTTSTATISIALASNPGAATLSGVADVDVVDGVATFTAIFVDEPEGGYTLTASTAGVPSVESDNFDVAPVPLRLFEEHVEGGVAVPGWIFDPPAVPAQIGWQVGQLAFGNGWDPNEGSLGETPGFAIGYYVNGSYGVLGLTPGPEYARSPEFDCTGYQDITLFYSRCLNLAPGDSASVEVSVDGTPVGTAESHTAGVFDGPLWNLVPAVDISQYATDRANVRILWGLGPTVPMGAPPTTGGWNIDEIEVYGTKICSPRRVVFIMQPMNTDAGLPIPPFTVEVQDSFGRRIEGATDTVTLSIDPDTDPTGGAAVLNGMLSVDAVDGMATFPGLNILEAGDGFQLVASAENLDDGLSAPFNVMPLPPSSLVFTEQPTNVAAGGVFDPAVEVTFLDMYGNVATTWGDLVTLALVNDPTAGAATLTGGGWVGTSNGVATFPAASIDVAAQGYTIEATSMMMLTTGESDAFDVSAGSPAQLVFTVQPSSIANPGDFITPAIEVEIQDANGNRVPGLTYTVHLEFLMDYGVTLTGTTTVNAVDGTAVFDDISVDSVTPALMELRAYSGSLAEDVSIDFSFIIP